MRGSVLASAAATALLVVAASGAAQAQSFASAYYSQYTYASSQQIQSSTAGSQISTNGPGCAVYGDCGDFASTSIVAQPDTTLTAHAFSLTDSTTAEAVLEFQVLALGLGGYVGPVPLHMIGHLDLGASSQNAKADLVLSLIDSPILVVSSNPLPPVFPPTVFERHCGDGDASCGIEDFDVSFFTSYAAGVDDFTDAIFDVEARTFEGDLGHAHFASVFLDPIFSIDPTFLAAHPGAYLEVTPEIGNGLAAGGVPEPATWALMIMGFGLAGGALRRRPSLGRRVA